MVAERYARDTHPFCFSYLFMAMATIENKEYEEQFCLSVIVKIKKKSDRMLRNSHHSITTILSMCVFQPAV